MAALGEDRPRHEGQQHNRDDVSCHAVTHLFFAGQAITPPPGSQCDEIAA
jgi:hypothetical protein